MTESTPLHSANINLTAYNLSTEPSVFNTTVAIRIFHPRPLYTFVIWFAVGTIGNCTAITILFRNKKRHKWKIFYRLVLMLAVSDLTGQVITIPIMFATYSNRDLLVTGGTLCHFMSTVTIMMSLMSVLLVCLMSIDRVMASWCPIFYKNSFTYSHVYMAVAVVIIITACVGILPNVGVNTHKVQREGTWCFVDLQPNESKGRAFLYLCGSIGIAAVLSMLVMNGMVIGRLCHMYKRTGNRRISSQPKLSSGVKNVQNIFFLLTIMTVFMSSWIPVIVRFINNATGVSDIDPEKDKDAVALAVIHQVLNPWIYIIMQDCLFSRCLNYARKHSKRGSLFHRILEDSETKQQELVTCR